MEYLLKLPNNQITFDWLEENIDSWYIDDENMETVVIGFSNKEDADFASACLNRS